jgi:hypothetical protein
LERPELLEAGETRAACWLYDRADKDAAHAVAESGYGEASHA